MNWIKFNLIVSIRWISNDAIVTWIIIKYHKNYLKFRIEFQFTNTIRTSMRKIIDWIKYILWCEKFSNENKNKTNWNILHVIVWLDPWLEQNLFHDCCSNKKKIWKIQFQLIQGMWLNNWKACRKSARIYFFEINRITNLNSIWNWKELLQFILE